MKVIDVSEEHAAFIFSVKEFFPAYCKFCVDTPNKRLFNVKPIKVLEF
jgi:hypothetical protein